MEVVIISKTRMQHAICVGAMLGNGTGIRLLDRNGYNQPFDTDYEIGEIWNVTFIERQEKREPHNEDVLVTSAKFTNKRINNLPNFFIKKLKVKIWRDTPNNLFDGKIRWTNSGSGYISARTGIPEHSVGFFISSVDIKYNNRHYIFPSGNPFSPEKKLAYVGCENSIEIIPAGTLIRVSMARWWKPEDIEIEERCYVQLSGWYLDPNKGKNILVAKLEKSLLIEKDEVVAIYFFQSTDNVNDLKVGDNIDWIKITNRKAIQKDSGEVAKLKDGREIYWAEKINQPDASDDLPF